MQEKKREKLAQKLEQKSLHNVTVITDMTDKLIFFDTKGRTLTDGKTSTRGPEKKTSGRHHRSGHLSHSNDIQVTVMTDEKKSGCFCHKLLPLQRRQYGIGQETRHDRIIVQSCVPSEKYKTLQLKSKIGNILAKDVSLRIHSPITLTNLSFLNLVSIFRCSSPPLNIVHTRRVDFSVLVFSLSSHRLSCISLLFSSLFIVS